MVQVPENTVTLNDLFHWYQLQEQLAKVKAQEMIMRQRVFKHYFPTPREGTNSFELGPELVAAGFPDDGRVLKGVYSMNRDVDKAALTTLGPMLVEKKLSVDKLIEWKPSLKKGEYNKLTAEEKALFDQVLIVKPGSPSMEVVLPASAKKAE